MTLLDACEPLFLAVCRLNRAGRKHAPVSYAEARSEIERTLERVAETCRGSRELAADHEKIELALIFFVDSMLAESGLPLAKEWNGNRLAYDRGERAGDEKFFDILDETLRDTSTNGLERLAVLYTCLGLGFEGFYAGDESYLAAKLDECKSRLRGRLAQGTGRVCPEAYQSTDRRVLFEPVSAKVGLIAVVTAALLVMLLAVDWVLFDVTTDDIEQGLSGVTEASWATTPAVEPAADIAPGGEEGTP